MNTPSPRLPVVVLISGKGSNLQALIEASRLPGSAIEIRAVISNRPTAGGLGLARDAGIACDVVDHTRYTDRRAFDTHLQEVIDRYAPGLVVLAGFMRILTPEFVRHFLGRMLNIHPSLLPLLPGLNTHQRALDEGMREHGASVHFVTAELDGGPVVLQGRVPVFAGEPASALAARVHTVEHRIYPLAVQWYAQGRLRLCGERACLDGKVLPPSGADGV